MKDSRIACDQVTKVRKRTRALHPHIVHSYCYTWFLGPSLRGISRDSLRVLIHCYLGSIFSPVHSLLQPASSVHLNLLYPPSSTTLISTTLHNHLPLLQSANVHRLTSSSHDTTHLSLSLQIQHIHWHPDNNRLSAVALLRA